MCLLASTEKQGWPLALQSGRSEQGCFYLEVLQGLQQGRISCSRSAVGSAGLLPLEAGRKQDCSSALNVGSSWLPTKWSRAKPSCAGASSCSIFINICERGEKQCYCATNQTGNYVICLNCVLRSRKTTRSSGWESGRRDLPADSVLHTLRCPHLASLSWRLVGQLAFRFLIISGVYSGT